MCIRYLSFLLIAFLAIGVSGCLEEKNESALPQPLSLGQEFSTFQPPVKPAQVEEVTKMSEPTGVITMKDALALALMGNPKLKAFSWGIRVTEAKQLQASLKPNPELGVEFENVGGTGPRSGFDGAETTIQLSQLIEMGDKRKKRTKLASLEKKLAGWDYEARRLDVFTEVNKAFIGVLAAQKRLALTQELLRLSEDLLDTVTKRVRAGKDSPLEKTKASVTLSNIEIQHRQSVEKLKFARKQLASTWGSSKTEFESAAGKFDSFSPIPPIEDLRGLIEQNPDIARWASEIDKSKASLELEKSKAIGDITISGGMRRLSVTNDNAIVFGISMPLPVSNRNQGGKRRAIYELARTRQLQRAAHSRVQIEFDRAYQDLSNSYTKASLLSKSVLQGSKSVYAASKTAYSQGKLDYLNVLDAQRTLFEANGQYIEALASYHTAKAQVERLIGRSIDSETLSKDRD
ncbi:MAG: TolC family protein [Planctomycetes bacterium]|nr:TolC family protein [Planctomycetota bacterium]